MVENPLKDNFYIQTGNQPRLKGHSFRINLSTLQLVLVPCNVASVKHFQVLHYSVFYISSPI